MLVWGFVFLLVHLFYSLFDFSLCFVWVLAVDLLVLLICVCALLCCLILINGLIVLCMVSLYITRYY